MDGAFGNTKRILMDGSSPSSGNTGTKSDPSAPSPCIQMTDHSQVSWVWSSMVSSSSVMGSEIVCNGAYFFLAFLPATAVLKVAPAVKRGTVEAAILMAAPVAGLRPVRAARLEDLKVPKPTRVTVSPLATALTIVSIVAFRARSASALVSSEDLAMASISS